jgi:transcriptional regulator with XRE-family HTH domain
MTYKGRFAPDPESEDHEDEAKSKLSAALGRNLRQLRQKRGFSLEQLAEISQVSRAMLGQIETGKSAPTINTVGLIAHALKVSISTLLTGQMPLTTVVKLQDVSTVLASAEGSTSSRVIAAWRDLSGAELHGICLAEGRSISFAPASEGIKKSLIVTAGTLGIEIGDEPPIALSDEDAIIFCANQNHALRNLGSVEARAFLVIAGVDMFNWQEERSFLVPIAPDALTKVSGI